LAAFILFYYIEYIVINAREKMMKDIKYPWQGVRLLARGMNV